MSQTPTTYGLPKKREEVIEELKLAYSNQNLEDQEYERRLNEAMTAKSIEDLMLVIFDFPAEIKYRIFPKDYSLPASQMESMNLPMSASPKTQVILGNESRNMPEFSNALSKISSILSTQKLDFRLSLVPETPINIHIECILSSTVIDLRNENLAGKHINIHVSGALGEIKIMLPRGVSIQRNIQVVAGEFKIQDKQRSWIKRLTGIGSKETQNEIQLTVNLQGIFWLGNIRVIY
ncbi:MAG: LiaF-related protein [Microscillaceae bacterium]|nr:LiaF-related protein [Microscillaceae bacterium]